MQCIKCGKETQNLYQCYSADIAGQTSTQTRQGKTVTTTTTTSYNNFNTHQDYICNKCICGKGRIAGFTIFATVLLVVGALLLVAMISAFKSEEFWLGTFCLIFGVGMPATSIMFFRSVFRGAGKRKTDDRLDEKFDEQFNGSATLVRHEKKNKPGRTYFTSKAYGELLLKNMSNYFGQ